VLSLQSDDLDSVCEPYTEDYFRQLVVTVTALVEGTRAFLLEQRISDLESMLDDMRTQRDDMRRQRDAWQRQAETSQQALTDQREKAATPPKQTWWRWLRTTG
jgi:hypothetical protein